MLTGKEIEELIRDLSFTPRTKKGWLHVIKRANEAQLAKAEPLVRKSERGRMIAIMKTHRRVTSEPGVMVYFHSQEWKALEKEEG